MYNRLPKLTILDEEAFSRYRVRYCHPYTKIQKYVQVSYGRTMTKEQAYDKIVKKNYRTFLDFLPTSTPRW